MNKRRLCMILAWLLLLTSMMVNVITGYAQETVLSDEAENLIDDLDVAENDMEILPEDSNAAAGDSENLDSEASDETDDLVLSEIQIESIEEVEDPLLADEDTQETETEIQIWETEETYINPLYADVITEEDLVQPQTQSRRKSRAVSTAYVSFEEAVDDFRNQMKQRNEKITLYVKISYDYYDGIMKDISSSAMTHTGDPVEGDYLKWQYAGWKGTRSYYTLSGQTYLTFTYTMTYYTTAEQEAAVTTRISALIDELKLKDTSKCQYEKIKTIYDYICSNVTYDYTNLSDTSYTLKYSAYAALINGTAVCQGYALLFYRMALECGIDARLIPGTGGTGTKQVAHGWNIVKIGNVYYNIDSTWDAGSASYRYFLKSSGNFAGHTRDEDYMTDAFSQTYMMSSEDYDASSNVTGHNMTVEMIEQEATCITAGSYHMQCSVCGYKGETLSIPATGNHSMTVEVIEQEATCIMVGSYHKECSACGYKGETLSIPATGNHNMTVEVIEQEATCGTAGSYHMQCSVCGYKGETLSIPATGNHNMTVEVIEQEATCGTAGSYHMKCSVCGYKGETLSIPATGNHNMTVKVIDQEETCDVAGSYHMKCSVCGYKGETLSIPATNNHSWGTWTKLSDATVFAAEQQIRTCNVKGCEETETRYNGKSLTPTITLTASSLGMKTGQSTTDFKVWGFANGDSLASVTSSNESVVQATKVKADGTFQLTAKKKTGSATLTIRLASGLTKYVTVTVKTTAVKTTSISEVSKKLSIQKGKTAVLNPVLAPVTSQDKIQYKSSNKKVATVSSKGVIKGISPGTATITVQAGTKKVTCKVTVTGIKNTKLTGIKSSLTLKKGKSTTLKPKRYPSNSTDTITYSSSNKKVATVSSTGKITAKKAGKTVITVKCGSAVVKCTVKVK